MLEIGTLDENEGKEKAGWCGKKKKKEWRSAALLKGQQEDAHGWKRVQR